MDWWLLTFFLGAILSLFLPEVPTSFQLFLVFCLAIAFFSHKSLRNSSGLWFGAICVLVQAHFYQGQLPDTFFTLMQNKQTLFIEGKVESIQPGSTLPKIKNTERLGTDKVDNTIRFNFLVSHINQQVLDSPVLVRLSWKGANIAIAQGNQLSLQAKLKPAHGLKNLGSFNYLTWLKAHNIVATGYIVSPKKNQQAKLINHRISNKITYRQQLLDQYQNLAPVHQLTPILLALAFGERSSLSPELWQTLQITGTSHLIAISGLHVGLLAGSTFFVVMILVRYLPITASKWQHINVRYLAIILSIISATIYAYLAGFSLPTQRALVMLNLYWFSRLMGINFSVKRLLLITVFILLVLSPFSLLTASFWLSFYAVAIIFVTLWRFKFWLNRGSTFWQFIKGLLIIQLALTFMLMPITSIFFQQVSLVSLAANIIAVPWMSVISIPATLLSVLIMPFSELLSQWFMMLSLQSLSWLWHYLQLLSQQSYAVVTLSLGQQLILSLLGIVVFIFCYFSPNSLSYFTNFGRIKSFVINVKTSSAQLFKGISQQKKIRYLKATSCVSVLIIMACLLFTYDWLKSKNVVAQKVIYTPWQAVYFDVGQGLSVLIKRNGRAILYDTGAAYPSGFNMSDSVILPYLQYLSVDKLDKVILSHSDNDHAGGINQLIANITIDEIRSNDIAIIGVSDKNREIKTSPQQKPCNLDHSFIWQGLNFDILWPLSVNISDNENRRVKQKNDDSCVILISDEKGRNLFLTGDISAKVELQLLTLYPKLTADILQVPHHGSKTSSSQAFLTQLSPQLGLVSAGFLNRWNMPVAQVKQSYQSLNIPLLNSAELGQVIITFNEDEYKARSYSQDLRPFWFSN
ncbi:DNA internalization-related competence protein ComEC/Rec2 [Colwellia echini]|uniref:DNA internalization-related competence protein ComEC/Rec2 n=1 Tax=Colwellia echini TaxID=1982103 RepID=A0ABY3MU74_9GAMM|nr:DNA internalization-related competence protein ComEC/Rec2 [Colwellia echini]TYK64739.1 DNA internalization-related competence protein ComEC/Rec2 [Colwellia echini]